MFDGASNDQLGGDILRSYDPKLTVIPGFEHTVSLFFNDIENSNGEQDISSSQGNLQYIWIRHISQALFCFQIQIL